MSDTLTPERIAELRRIAEAVQKYRCNSQSWQDAATFKEEGWVQEFAQYFAAIDADSLLALLGAADLVEALAAENTRLSDLLARVKRILPPGELYEAILNALYEGKS